MKKKDKIAAVLEIMAGVDRRAELERMAWYDISFCLNKTCDRVDCRRHRSRMPVGIPVTASLFAGGDDCEWYLEV